MSALKKLTPLDDAFIRAVERPILRTWQTIGHDIADAAGGEEIDEETAMECVLDADHLRTFGGDRRRDEEGNAAADLVDLAIEAHGYEKVLRFLARRLRLGV